MDLTTVQEQLKLLHITSEENVYPYRKMEAKYTYKLLNDVFTYLDNLENLTGELNIIEIKFSIRGYSCMFFNISLDEEDGLTVYNSYSNGEYVKYGGIRRFDKEVRKAWTFEAALTELEELVKLADENYADKQFLINKMEQLRQDVLPEDQKS